MPDEVIRWKEELLRSGISGRSVREVYLAALKVVFGWAVENRKVLVNPVTGISVRFAKAARLRERGFTAIEARTILLAALAGNNGNVSEAHRRARRWVPFLCAYTGAESGIGRDPDDHFMRVRAHAHLFDGISQNMGLGMLARDPHFHRARRGRGGLAAGQSQYDSADVRFVADIGRDDLHGERRCQRDTGVIDGFHGGGEAGGSLEQDVLRSMS